MGKKETQFQLGYDNGKMNVLSDVMYHLKQVTSLDELKDYLEQEYKEYIPVFGKTEPTAFEKKFCFLKTYKYRGQSIDIFMDDAGQQDYFYFNDRSVSCGTYNPDAESVVRYVVDKYLDEICSLESFDKRFFGAYIRYKDPEHTKVVLNYRLETLKEFDASLGVETIRQQSLEVMNNLFNNPEFQKAEKARRERGDLYFAELVEESEK